MPDIPPGDPAEPPERSPEPSLPTRLRRLVIGHPRDLGESGLFHRLALVPFLAWVGLGADGLSSSSYGPEEAFRTLGEHTYLALLLAAVMAGTVFLISAAYSRIIEQFPTGGGGYLVATKLLGPRAGVISGSALLVDYALGHPLGRPNDPELQTRILREALALLSHPGPPPVLERAVSTAPISASGSFQ